jgi:predicted metal-dependent enzyme (double-stranded beta helix superfamily)
MDRRREIELAVVDIREIEKRDGVTRQSLEKIKQRLIRLAKPELFPASDFPPPAPGGKLKSCLYRVSEDADHRFALYVNASLGGHATPAHNHTTWAVIVGVTGEELNRFYDRAAEGPPRQKGEYMVKQGTGVCFLPEDLHSIHIQAPLVNFHMYGLALDRLDRREYFQAAESKWKVFPAHGDIREAR